MIPLFGANPEACFSPDYRTARARFIAACRDAGVEPEANANPNPGPHGEELGADVAWFGPSDAGRVLVLTSATHGIEGFSGSAAQLDLLWRGGQRQLPPDTALLIAHALNPHGFAWLRRVTEEGVDLNRNGIDFSKPLPDNPGYAELADAFVPAALSGPEFEAGEARLAAYRAAHGAAAFEHARSGGQHTHPEGVFYGGTAPTWSRRTLEAIIARHGLARRRHVAVIDFHTGLGPYGHGEPIVGHRPGEPGQARCRAWYGNSLGEPLLGTSASLPIAGLTQYIWGREVGQDRLTFVALEFGTFPGDQGRIAMQADHWLHRAGAPDWEKPQTQHIKAGLKRFYHPDTADWRELVIFRSRQVIAQALAGLAGL